MIETFDSGPQPQTKEQLKAAEWNAIVHNSFLFSQGLYTLQTPITRWLAMGPLYDEYLSDTARGSVKESTGKYMRAITGNANHSSTTAEGEPITSPSAEADKVLDNFQYELDSAFTFSDAERAHQKEIALGRIAEGLVQRDRTFLLEREGRPIPDEKSRRDKWSSFIIDFGVFHKGDGVYTWERTTEPFKKLWEEVLPVIRERHAEEMQAIVEKYIAMHPNLSEDEKSQIKALYI